MVYQPPTGARDLLPLDVAQKIWIEKRLQQVFHRWGYHQIITSTLERMDTLMAGGAIEAEAIFQLQGMGEEALGLRSELTASIARTVATRIMAGKSLDALPARLFYNANVFCRASEGSHSTRHEFHQAGVELLGVGGTLADAEALLLVMDCLASLGLSGPDIPRCQILLGEAGLTRSLLSVFPEGLRTQVRDALAKLDRLALEAMPLTPDQQRHALLLMDLRGKPGWVLEKVKQLDLNAQQQQQVAQLKALVELLQTTQDLGDSLVLDLSLIRTFDYYTGVVFEVVVQGQVMGQGGRYDRLLEIYDPQGRSIPGVGFGLQLERLQQVLALTDRLPQQVAVSDWLVVPKNALAQGAALHHAQKLRQGEARVEMGLGMGGEPAEILAYAQRRQIGQVAWVDHQGLVTTETISQ
jgi:ATP phosphoribosyltransferase regulatory subunit